MTTETFAIDTLERLSSLELEGHAVLSLYVDLDPSRFPTPAARDAQLGSLFGAAQRGAAERALGGVQRDLELVEAMLLADPTITRGAAALAIFSCAQAGILETVRLPTAVEPMAVVDAVPWLEPLAGIISPGAWGVAVVGRRDATMLRGGPHGLSQFARVHDEVHRRHAQGGWSQSRFQRGIEQEVAWHVGAVADRLLRAHRRRGFEHLAIVASDELQPVVERSLHTELKDVLAGTVRADLEHATVQEIERAIAPVIESSEHDRERTLVATVEHGLRTGGAAAAGLDEVLAMLEQHRVDTLLVPEQSTLVAGVCPQCGRLSDADDLRCPLDGAALSEVDAVEHAVEAAAAQCVQIAVIRHENEWLGEHGQIAARLRW